MNKIAAVAAATVLLIVAADAAVCWKVPENRTTIQDAITSLAHDGDTVSVWGPQGITPPYTYHENINFEGKSILVVNRSFLSNGGTGYDSSWDHVIIDGTNSNTVVAMNGSEDAVLKGFTIQHGRSNWYGGGVSCIGGAILKNHILDNHSAVGGGGVSYQVDWDEPDNCWIYDNLIEDDSSSTGGGIFVVGRGCSIRRNVVRNNIATDSGGGICLSLCQLPYGMSSLQPDDSITDNVIDSNHLAGSNVKGGGIMSWNWGRAPRRNVVRGNDSNGIYDYSDSLGTHLDLGTADTNPGFNVMMGNGSHDLVVVDGPENHAAHYYYAVGNYWGFLDTHTILGRVSLNGPYEVRYDPVAASSKWFDVDLEPLSTCSTSVLVTGDLRVMRSLTVVPGKTFEFYPNPDTSFCNANTELILMDSGTVLTSVGTAEEPIRYVLHPGPVEANWFGIRVHSYARAIRLERNQACIQRNPR